jgi:DHA1 family bicyclomycin/chloramphenicol resistance-like MFS transporter
MPKASRPPLALLIAMVTFGPVSIDIFLPSLPDMTRVFATDVSHVQTTLSIFIAGFALAQLVLGPLSDRFGRRPVLLAGTGLYCAASVLCLFARSIDTLILARLLQAFGACAGPVLSRAIVRDVFPPDRAARTLAVMASIMAIAPALAPVVGGLLHAWFDWRANFVVMTLFGLALWTGVQLLLAETNQRPDRKALRPARMLAAYGMLATHRGFLRYTLALSFLFAAMFSFISGGSFVLISVLGIKPEHFGIFFAMVVCGLLAGNLATAQLSHRLSPDRLIGTGLVIATVSSVPLVGLALAHVQTIAAVVAPMAGLFLAAGLILPNGTAAAIAPHGRIAGSASALLGFIQMGIAASAGWAVGRLDNGTTLPMAATVGTMVAVAALAFLLLRPKPGLKI